MSDVQDIEQTAWGRPPRPPAPGWGRPPTGVWPPCPPGPPGPWPGGLFRLEQCWDDVKATRAFLTKIIKDILADDPSIIGLAQPIIGVTDGTEAQPGQVGEFVQWVIDPIAIPAAGLDQTKVVGVLQPGDWDLWAIVGLYVPVGSLFVSLDPVPPGLSAGALLANEVNVNPGDQTLTTFSLPPGRLLISAPTLIAFRIVSNTYQAGTAGNINLVFCARRRR